jgi:hypothetical protein
MTDREHDLDLKPVARFSYWFAGTGAVALIVALSAFADPQPANATASYAQQTGLACGRCHSNPAGGGSLTAFGKAFAANGHKLPAKTKASQEPVQPSVVSVPNVVPRHPWAAPHLCYGWCPGRD